MWDESLDRDELKTGSAPDRDLDLNKPEPELPTELESDPSAPLTIIMKTFNVIEC